jgi:RNA polymerase sigma factor (sigma-70 family)
LRKVTRRAKKIFSGSFGLQYGKNSIKYYELVKQDLSEQDLLNGLAVSDNRCIELIYRQHYPLIQALVVNNSGSADDARDIFQEALLVLYEKVKAGGFELQCQIKTYLFSVARRLWLKKLQQNNKSGSVESLEEIVPVEDEVEQHELQDRQMEMMHDALAKIGEPCKSLLEAYYFGKRNMQDIAADFGYTNADNAKNQKYKCLIRLKKLFFAQHKNL